MTKTGFRGERKRILSPSLSQGEGCSDKGRGTKKGNNDEGRMTNEEGRDRQMTKEQ